MSVQQQVIVPILVVFLRLLWVHLLVAVRLQNEFTFLSSIFLVYLIFGMMDFSSQLCYRSYFERSLPIIFLFRLSKVPHLSVAGSIIAGFASYPCHSMAYLVSSYSFSCSISMTAYPCPLSSLSLLPTGFLFWGSDIVLQPIWSLSTYSLLRVLLYPGISSHSSNHSHCW